MGVFRIGAVLGLFAVAISFACLQFLPAGAITWTNLQATPGNTLSMLTHFASGRFGHLRRTGQVGDGREAAVLKHVRETVSFGNAELVLRAIDDLASTRTFLMNVGPQKGLILDEAIRKREPCLALEIGAYVGYSGVRIGSQLKPGCKLYSIEFNPDNADVARGMIKHAGLEKTVEVITGTLETTASTLQEKTGGSTFDFIFLDHFKNFYLSDLKILLQKGFLKEGSVVVADNVGFPGVPDYLEFMEQSKEFDTTKHQTNLEYSKTVDDLVLVSIYKGQQ